MRWSAKSGMVYQVQVAPSLPGLWTNAADGVDADGQSLRTATSNGVLRYVDADTVATTRFYRVKWQGP